MYKNRTPAEDAHFFSSPCSSSVDVLQGTFVVRLHAVHDVGALVDFCKDEVALMRHRSRLSSCACTLLLWIAKRWQVSSSFGARWHWTIDFACGRKQL